jgi:hypothetical protein
MVQNAGIQASRHLEIGTELWSLKAS